MQNVFQCQCRSEADIYKSAGQTRKLHALILNNYSNYLYFHFCSLNNTVTCLCYDNNITVLCLYILSTKSRGYWDIKNLEN